MDLLIFIITLSAAYLIGTKVIEKKHYQSIKERERKFLTLPAITAKNVLEPNQKIQSAQLISGSVVISIDNFKKFLAGLRNIFGGEIHSYETILDRARREAVLRMKENAPNADIIINMRLETSTIGRTNRNKSIGCSEILAYGTAITFIGEKPKIVQQPINQDVIKEPISPVTKEKIKPRAESSEWGTFEYLILGVAILILLVFMLLLFK